MDKIVGLKELRSNIDTYISEVKKGKTFVVVRKSKPVFKVGPIDEDGGAWETVADFTSIKKGGIDFRDILSKL